MKDSRNQYNKKRNSSYSSDSDANERITKYWIKSIFSYIVTLIVGLTAFFFLFPELITKILPSFSQASSSFITKLRDVLSTPLLRVILSIGLITLLVLVLWFYSPYIITKDQEVFCQRKVFFPFFYRASSILLVSQDSDFGKGDIYFTISHETTQTSQTAWDDYEDGISAEHVLNNNDFDGSGYYDKEYNNIRLNVGLLDWIIKVWDEDNGEDALLFKARLTVKDTDTTGERQFNDVWTYAEWDFPYIEVETYENSYLKFDWLDGRRKYWSNYYNGLILKVTLNYHT
ncbi:MAG: hypothetical protein HGN29_15265 [Asgard group archaeon]|nr:hypothetical protein [Asgard group archaeon]